MCTQSDTYPKNTVEVGLGVVIREIPLYGGSTPSIEVLITRRRAGTVYAGWWELPGGKIDPGEGVDDAVVRELGEEVGVLARVVEALPTVEHTYAHARVRLHPRLCVLEAASPEPRPLEVAECRWIPAAALRDYAFPEANGAVVTAVLVRLAAPGNPPV